MKVHIGSKNATKVDAVKLVLATSPLFVGATILGVDVKVETFGHPKTLAEVVAGAVDRAKQAFVGADYGVGIEGGLMDVPQTKTGAMEVAVCAFYDGKQVHLGLSPAYEWPTAVHDAITRQGLDGSQALKAAGFTDQEKIGAALGGIFLLTNGRMNRTELHIPAVQMALMHLEHPKHFV